MFPLPGDGDYAPSGAVGDFSFQETGCAPHFFFSLPEKKKRAAPGAKKKRDLVADLRVAVPLFCCAGG